MQDEGCADSLVGSNLDVSTCGGHNPLRYGQPEARAPILRGDKGDEEIGKDALRNSRARVRHTNLDPRSIGTEDVDLLPFSRLDDELSTRGLHGLDRVVHEIDENLPKLFHIDAYGWRRARKG